MNSFTQKFSYIFLSALLLFSCVPNKGGVKSNINSKLSTPSTSQTLGSVSVSSVEVVNNQLVITGRNFDNIKKIKVEGPYLNENFTIESISSSRIVANAMKAIQIGVNGVVGMQGVFNLIMSDANAAATFAVSFTLQDRSVTANKLSSMGAQVGQVLKYNGTTWVPANLSSSQLYLGTYDASTDQIVGSGAPISSVTANPGDYFIVTVAGVYNSVTYPVNSWIMYNGTSWELISNGESFVSSFKGRRGVVVPAKGDYTLGQMNDVTLTAPANNDVLTYESATSQWKAVQLPLRSVTASAPLVSSGGQTTDISFASTSQNFVLAGPASGSGVPAFRALGIADLPLITSYVAGATAKTAIAATDTIPQALGKVQGYLNALDGDYVSLSAGVTSTVNGTVDFFAPTSYLYVNTPTALATDREAVNVKYVKDYVATKGVWDQGTNVADVVRATGNVGIGTTAPQTKFNIVDNNSADEYQIQVDRFSGDVAVAPTPAGIRLNSARGVEGVGAVAVNGDELGKIDFGSGDSPTHITEGAVIKGVASGTWSAGSPGTHPTDIVFLTSPNAPSAPLERMRIYGDTGNISVAGTVHAAKFVGDGSALTGVGASGGVANVGSTSIAADIGATGVGEIGFSTKGQTRMTIANDGRVGVGSTAAPGGLFAVAGSGNTELFRVIDNATAINFAELTGGSGNTLGPVFTANGAATDIGLQINSKGAGNLILNGSGTGKVGIGTTNPGSLLHVYGNAGGERIMVETAAVGAAAGVSMDISRNLPTQYGNLNWRTGGTLNWTIGQYANSNLSFVERVTGLPAVTIQQTTGNVGIGTTAPATKLDVRSAVTGDSDGRQSMILADTSALAANIGPDLMFYTTYLSDGTPAATARIGTRREDAVSGNVATALTFGTRPNANNIVERMRIDSAGNIGIGTTSPAATALLDMTSTAKGLLIPRMTTAQKTAIVTPATGLQVYDTDQKAINFYNGTAWQGILNGTSTSVAGTSGGIPYYNGTTMASSAALAANALVIGGGAGAAPTTISTGTSGYVLTSAGASAPAWTQFVPVANGGTGAALTTATAGAMPYFNSATTMAVATAPANLTQPNVLLSSGAGVPTWTNSTAGNFLKGSVTGVGFDVITSTDITSALTTALATPGAIGGTTPAAGNFTSLGVGFSTAPTAPLDIKQTTALGGALNDNVKIATFQSPGGSGGNNVFHNEWRLRDVAGTTWTTQRIHDGISVDASYVTPRTDTRTFWERDPQHDIQTWGTGTADYFTINAGNVGIANATPRTKLDVNLAGNATLTTIQQNVNANAIAISSLYGTGGNYLPGLEWYTTDNNPTKPKAGVWAFADGSGSKILFGTSNSYTTGITNTAMAIDSAGKVGIGTPAPSYPLDVQGDVEIGVGTITYPTTPAGVAAITYNGSSILRNVMNDGTGNYQQYLNSYYDSTAVAHKYVLAAPANRFVTSGGTYAFYVAPAGALAGDIITWITALSIDNAGNVGIGGVAAPNSKLEVGGAIATAVATKTSAYTLTAADSVITGNAATAAFSLTLPTAIGAKGREYTIKKIDASVNEVTIATTSAQTIDGGATAILDNQYQSITLVSDNANWIVTGRSGLPRPFNFSFTTCGQNGNTGPALATCVAAYSSYASWASSTANLSMATNGIQRWTVPYTGKYRITAAGASGGGGGNTYTATGTDYSAIGGSGAVMSGTFSLVKGDVLSILVGQKGMSGAGYHGNENGGGGGTFVIRGATGTSALIVAGGGGGGYSLYYGAAPATCPRKNGQGDGVVGATANTITCAGYATAGGSGGTGGSTMTAAATYAGGGGGGLTGNGTSGIVHCAAGVGGTSFSAGGIGGTGNSCYVSIYDNAGGFGGGGGGNLGGPGGGGGYSGGASAGLWSGQSTWGGGGASYNIGTEQNNRGGANFGHGYVSVERIQ